MIMLDSPAPGAIAASIVDEADLLAFVTRLLGRPVPVDELRRLSPDLQERRIVDLIAEFLPERLDRDASRIYVDTLRANARAMSRYRPGPSEATPAMLVAAEVRDQGQPLQPARGWQPLLRGALSTQTVPGGHLSMLAEPHVTATARSIERAIERSRSCRLPSARARVAI
jgi:thioesterase domain-containing protein